MNRSAPATLTGREGSVPWGATATSWSTTMAMANPVSAPVADLDPDTRAAFLGRVYQHLALAVAAFVVFDVHSSRTGVPATRRRRPPPPAGQQAQDVPGRSCRPRTRRG